MTVIAGYLVLALVTVLYLRWEWWQSDVAHQARAHDRGAAGPLAAAAECQVVRALLQLVAGNVVCRLSEWTDREPLMGETLIDRMGRLLSADRVKS